MTNKFTAPVQFNRNPVTSNRGLKKLGRNVFYSLAFPLVMVIIAIILAQCANEALFIVPGYPKDTLANIMELIKKITLTIIAAMALNANLNSGRMDFSLGATGILATLIAAKILNFEVGSVSAILNLLLLSVAFGLVLGLINSLVFIFLKIPPIVMSLGMCLVFEGIAKIIAGDNATVQLSGSEITGNFFIEPVVIIPILAICVIFMMLALCYTKWGYDKNALVWNQKIAVDTGIKEVSNCVICFLIAGALIAVYTSISCLDLAKIDVKINLASSGEVFKNFLPIFIGGILAKYSNQIGGLLLAVFGTVMLSMGMDAANQIGFSADVQSLINGFSVFAVLVYMVDKDRFVNWCKKQKYIITQKYLGKSAIGGEDQ